MKKYIMIFLAVTIAVSGLSSCDSTAKKNIKDDKIHIITTIFPEYDWVKNIIGENASNIDVDLLIDNGVDLHSYQPSAEDMLKISTADIFIYVGGESDEWVKDALSEAMNNDMTAIALLDVLGSFAREEETVIGMQTDIENNTDDVEYDEHIWLSLRNAALLVEAVSDQICSVEPDNAEIYRDNTKKYIEQLSALDKEYESAVEAADKNTVIFGDRFPFRYMTDDYGLSYYAAFSGCSAETEASFDTITFLADKVDELNLNAVMTVEHSDRRIAQAIVQNTKNNNQQILEMDSMQSVTSNDINNGVSYFSIMKNNLEILKTALE